MAKSKASPLPVQTQAPPPPRHDPADDKRNPTLDIDDPSLKNAPSIAIIAADILRIKAKISGDLATIEEKRVILRALMEDTDTSQSWTIRGNNWISCYVKNKPRRTLIPEKLVQHGVKIEVIEKCYKDTPVSPSVSVRAVNEKE
jgi:hypothetical protein